MKTLQSELTKYRHFLSEMRHLSQANQGENVMQQETITRPSANASNRRYKRSSDELDADVEKVDKLVASGKFNQIEALNEVGLQSSVYHYRKRQLRQAPAKSKKPRKFTHRTRTFEQRKKDLIEKLEAAPKVRTSDDKIREELLALRQKYDKLKEYVVESILNQ